MKVGKAKDTTAHTPRPGGIGRGKEAGLLSTILAFLFGFLLTLVKAGALQLLLLFYIALASKEYRPTMEKTQTTGRKRISRNRKSSSRNEYSCPKQMHYLHP